MGSTGRGAVPARGRPRQPGQRDGPGLDLEDACDDEPSICDASYPLYGDYTTGMPMFVGREMLKLLRVTLNLVGWVGFLLAFYIIFSYGFMLFQLTRGHPGVLSKVFRIGFIQAAMEFVLWMYVSSAADTVYSLPFRYSFKLVFFLALAIMFLSQLPSVKRYCSRFRLEYKGKEGGPNATPSMAGAPNAGAPTPSAAGLQPGVPAATPAPGAMAGSAPVAMPHGAPGSMPGTATDAAPQGALGSGAATALRPQAPAGMAPAPGPANAVMPQAPAGMAPAPGPALEADASPEPAAANRPPGSEETGGPLG